MRKYKTFLAYSCFQERTFNYRVMLNIISFQIELITFLFMLRLAKHLHHLITTTHEIMQTKS